MKNKLKHIPVILAVILLTSCAATYKPIQPSTLNYNAHDLQDGISLSFKYDVLRERGNKRYAKKEDFKGVRMVAVKVTNHTDSALIIGKNAAFFSAQTQLFPLEPAVMYQTIKQSAASYLPYMILSFVKLTIQNKNSSYGDVDVYPIGLLIGPAITFGNITVASSANANLRREINSCDIFNKPIQPGETAYGMIGLRGWDFLPLSVKWSPGNTH